MSCGDGEAILLAVEFCHIPNDYPAKQAFSDVLGDVSIEFGMLPAWSSKGTDAETRKIGNEVGTTWIQDSSRVEMSEVVLEIPKQAKVLDLFLVSGGPLYFLATRQIYCLPIFS